MALDFKKFARDLFTGRDNKTYDIGRVLWFQSVQAFVAVTIYALYKGGSFDPVTWGAGLSALIAGGGAAIGLKAGTEPNKGAGPDDDDDYLARVGRAKRRADRLKAGATDEPDMSDGDGSDEYHR